MQIYNLEEGASLLKKNDAAFIVGMHFVSRRLSLNLNFCVICITLIAVALAVDECIETGVLKKFLIEHRTEVEDMIRIDGTWEEYEELIKQEAYEDGIETGREQGIEQGIEQNQLHSVQKLMASTGWDLESAMEKLDFSEEDKNRIRLQVGN